MWPRLIWRGSFPEMAIPAPWLFCFNVAALIWRRIVPRDGDPRSLVVLLQCGRA